MTGDKVPNRMVLFSFYPQSCPENADKCILGKRKYPDSNLEACYIEEKKEGTVNKSSSQKINFLCFSYMHQLQG